MEDDISCYDISQIEVMSSALIEIVFKFIFTQRVFDKMILAFFFLAFALNCTILNCEIITWITVQRVQAKL